MKPFRYDLTFKPDLKKFTFEGEEVIALRLAKATKTIVLHAKELKIASAQIVGGAEKITASRIAYDKKAETATFLFPKPIPKGNLWLKVIFRGMLNEKMRGFYRSRYKVNGKTRYMATTQFEATDARRAFPCFDEPAMKAEFNVTLIIPKEKTAISNMPPVEVHEYDRDHKVVQFGTTPKMSTYLLAFMIGDFEYIEKRTDEGVLVRISATPGKKRQMRFALDCAIRALSLYGRYFGIPYPLPALNLIAIPDFAAGAMENWGAVTYREAELLIDPRHSSTAAKQRVATVIAHELAHQWFGNLVTMEWWTHLWLNEGFASYMECFAVDRLFPEWDMQTQFVADQLDIALWSDALVSTHPIEVAVHHPDEIGEIFDAVSYSKGASVIRMLADYLGEKDFRAGLRHYLKKYSYANASTVDLWDAFEEVSGKPVAKMMGGWTQRPGYPLLTVSENNRGLLLRQSRFFLSPISRLESRGERAWFVPVRITAEHKKQEKKFLMKEKSMRLPAVGNRWFKCNAGEFGVFRTKYPASIREALKEPVRNKRLGARDRLGLVRDVMALAEAGEVTTAKALDFAAHYKGETDYSVWLILASRLHSIDLLIAGEPFAEGYRRFARDIFSGIAKKVGWKRRRGELHTQTLLRSLALNGFGAYGDLDTLARARKLFSRARGAKNPVPADLRGVVYGLVAKYGGRKEYAKLMEIYRRETLQEEKNRIGRALGAFKEERLLARTLDFSISKQVRFQDAASIIMGVWLNPLGRDLAWAFVRAHWNMFLDRYGSGHDLARLLMPAGHFTSFEKAKEVERFFKTHPAPGALRTIQQVLERIRANALWLSRDREQLDERFV